MATSNETILNAANAIFVEMERRATSINEASARVSSVRIMRDRRGSMHVRAIGTFQVNVHSLTATERERIRQ